MSSKRILGLKPPSKYIIITDPKGGHTQQCADFITFRQAKKLLKDENVLVYIFKVANMNYNDILLKYPVGEYYNALEINILNDDVWCSLNVENLKNKEKDFSEFIKLKTSYDEFYK